MRVKAVGILIAFGLACSACHTSVSLAQEYPSRPIRFVMPFPPGGAVDTIARVVGERLSARLGQQVVVDNRPGANGAIALDIVAASPADGHTMMAVAQSFLTHQAVYRDFGFTDNGSSGNRVRRGGRRLEPEITLKSGRVVWDRNGLTRDDWSGTVPQDGRLPQRRFLLVGALLAAPGLADRPVVSVS